MGEYERCNKMLFSEKLRLVHLKVELQRAINNKADEEKINTLVEEIAGVQQGIGEIEGALLEMAELDGLGDPNEAFY